MNTAARHSFAVLSSHAPGRRGTTLPEVLIAGVVTLAIACMLMVVNDRTRRLATQHDDIGKLQRIAGYTSQYASDNADRFWTFSWKKGPTPSQYPDLKNAFSEQEAATNQAVDILRRRTGIANFPKPFSWIPHVLYSHLVLQDYAGSELPDRTFISASDTNRLLWASDPAGFDQGKFMPNQPPPSGDNKRWPYSSSFTNPIAFWSSPWSGPDAIRNSGSHNTFVIPANVVFGGHLLSQVAHPSQKIITHDLYGRYQGTRVAFFGYAEARVLTTFVDGSTQMTTSKNANPGWDPGSPTGNFPMQYSYTPAIFEPPALSGIGNFATGYYRYTRQALLGRDVGGPEVK